MDHEREEPVFDLSATPLAAGIEAAMGNSRRLDQIAPEKPLEPAPEKRAWMVWDRGDADRGIG